MAPTKGYRPSSSFVVPIIMLGLRAGRQLVPRLDYPRVKAMHGVTRTNTGAPGVPRIDIGAASA